MSRAASLYDDFEPEMTAERGYRYLTWFIATLQRAPIESPDRVWLEDRLLALVKR